MTFDAKHTAILHQFGELVRIERLRRRMSQEDLGQKVGLSRQSLAAIEKAGVNTGLAYAIKLANALDISLDSLK